MRSGPSSKELARATDPGDVRAAGTVRRFGVASTSKVVWRLAGVRTEGGVEPVDAEVFSGIGIYARPGANGKPEAIVVNIGDARHPVIVATRDEDAARAIRGQLGAGKPAAGETLVFASVGSAVVYLKNDGTAEIRTASGTAHRLATIEDLEAHVAWAKSHKHDGVQTGTGTSSTPLTDPPNPDGTTVLRGE